MTKNKYGFKTVKRDADVGDRILITSCADAEVYNEGAVFTVTEVDVISKGDVRVGEYIGSKDWYIDSMEYEVIVESDNECGTVVLTLTDGTRIEGTPEQVHDLVRRLEGDNDGKLR